MHLWIYDYFMKLENNDSTLLPYRRPESFFNYFVCNGTGLSVMKPIWTNFLGVKYKS
jgi:hypothetical protein